VNSCGTENNKPAEKQDCSVKICTAGEQRCDGDDIVVCAQNEESWVLVKTCEEGCLNGMCGSGWITGLAFDATTLGIIGLIIVIIIIGAILYMKRKKK
jgi:LPXTG-motif cell wall-anchored protein